MPASIAPPVWVNTDQVMRRMLTDIQSHTRISVDTESNSLHAYRERVCLIQISTPGCDYLIDPLALPDLHALIPIFGNPQVEKIFHAAEYDLICLRRDFGFNFATIFDTMQAARILGYAFVGLDALLAEKFQVRMDKRHQKADWGARPLTPAQIDYARLDTHYLFGLRDLLETELRERDRLELARDDFARACRLDEPREKLNGSSWKKFSGRKDVSPRELTILAELCHRRDGIAEKLDRPPFKVIDDNLLLAIARNSPEQEIDLAGIGLSSRQIRLWGGEIIEAFRRGAEAPLMKRDQTKRPDDAILKRLDKLKTWRKQVAQELSVESDIVLPKTYMTLFAETPPQSLHEVERVMADSPWRVKTYGLQILTLLGG
jgi:ribonuclease D